MLKNNKPLIIGSVVAAVVAVGAAAVLFGPVPAGVNPVGELIAPVAAQAGPGMNPGARARMGAGPRMGGPRMGANAGMRPNGAMMGKGRMAAGKPGMGGTGAGRANMKAGPGAAKAGTLQEAAGISGPPAGVRPDPFLIPGTTGPINLPKPPVASLAPTHIITNFRPSVPPPPPPPAQTSLPGGMVTSLPGDRVEGIMMNNGIYAIMDSNGQSQVVQPGDTLPGGERVVSIQSDSVTLRTTANQTVNLPITGGTETAGTVGPPGSMPAGYNFAPPGAGYGYNDRDH